MSERLGWELGSSAHLSTAAFTSSSFHGFQFEMLDADAFIRSILGK